MAKKHQEAGFLITEIETPVIPLSKLLDNYQHTEIHWLKIDVEGMECQIIQGWQPSAVRPWIVVVESTEPLESKPTFSAWEPTLLGLGYKFVYFDGLNRFYVSVEHPELNQHFEAGPNIFDEFTLSGRANSPFCRMIQDDIDRKNHYIDALEDTTAKKDAYIETLRREAIQKSNYIEKIRDDIANNLALQNEVDQKKAELASVFASTSWRVTWILRFSKRTLSWFVRGAWAWITLKPGSRPRRLVQLIFGKTLSAAALRHQREISDNTHDISKSTRDASEEAQYIYSRISRLKGDANK